MTDCLLPRCVLPLFYGFMPWFLCVDFQKAPGVGMKSKLRRRKEVIGWEPGREVHTALEWSADNKIQALHGPMLAFAEDLAITGPNAVYHFLNMISLRHAVWQQRRTSLAD